jgi:DNA primase
VGLIPDEIISEIRARADIVSVIGQHVQLKRAGRNWKGLCPFHGEKSPSFNVSPTRGSSTASAATRRVTSSPS